MLLREKEAGEMVLKPTYLMRIKHLNNNNEAAGVTLMDCSSMVKSRDHGEWHTKYQIK